MSTSTPIFSCQFWNIWVKQFGQFHFHSYIWYEMNEGLIILYWRQHLNLINLIDFRDQLNVALKTDYKYFLTINLKKYLADICPMKGASEKNVIFRFFARHELIGQHTKFQTSQTPPSCFLRITLQIFEKYDKTQNQS